MVLDPSALLTKSISVEHRKIATATSVGWKFGPLPAGVYQLRALNSRGLPVDMRLFGRQQHSSGICSMTMHPDLAADGSQLGSPTFLIQEVSITPSIYHDHLGNYTPFSNTVGSGTGFLLRDGVEIPVFWNRVSATAPTTWTLKDGTPAYFHTGHIWVALTDQQPVFASPASSTPAPTSSK